MSSLYQMFQESGSSSEENDQTEQTKKENVPNIIEIQKSEEDFKKGEDLTPNEKYDDKSTEIQQPQILLNESTSFSLKNSTKENADDQSTSEFDGNSFKISNTIEIVQTNEIPLNHFFSESNKTEPKINKAKPQTDLIFYPILSETFIPKELQVYSNFQYPQNSTNVYQNWESIVVNAICSNYQNINLIKSFILGTWFIDSSSQFIQINFFNVNNFLSKEVLEETNLFRIDEENETISLKCDISSIDQTNSMFVFNKNKDLPFLLLVLDEAKNLSKVKTMFTLEDLFIILNQKTYRTPVNTYEIVVKEDLIRIQYIIDQSVYFSKTENGYYTKSEIPFGEFNENELTSNAAINAMIKNAPIGHCFYRSELKNILEKEGIQFSEEEIILNERVFYCSGRFGVRPKLQFKKQPRIRNLYNTNLDILNNLIIQTLSEISKPISISTLFSVIDGKKYFNEVNSSSTKIINEQIHSSIRLFMNLQPFIFCRNNKFFMIPKACECDLFGFVYICLIRDFLQKNGTNFNDENALKSKFNEIRFPLKNNQAVFIQSIESSITELRNFLEIPELTPISNRENDYIELFNTSQNDGEINKDAFVTKLPPEVSKEIALKQKINSILNTNPTRSNSESASADFHKRVKAKKILQEMIPDHQEIKDDESDRMRSEDDFESDSSVSDLEKKLIRLARRFYNPKILKYSTPKSFVDELIGQESVNKDGKEFIINNDQESVDLVTKELLNSKRFRPNKENEQFCYIGKIENQQKISTKVSQKNKKDDDDSNKLILTDKNESKDMFSDLDIFNNSSDDDEINKNISDSYSYSSSDANDSYVGVDLDLKWNHPKIKNHDNINKNPLSIVKSEKRNLPIEPNEFAPKRLLKANQRKLLIEKLKGMNKSKDHMGPDKYQLFYLYEDYRNIMSIEDFENYVIELEGMIYGENH